MRGLGPYPQIPPKSSKKRPGGRREGMEALRTRVQSAGPETENAPREMVY